MIWNVLRIILEHEDGSAFLKLRLRDPLDDPADCMMADDKVRLWGRLVGQRTREVIDGQPDDLQLRHLTRSHEAGQLAQVHIGATPILNFEVIAGKLATGFREQERLHPR